MISIIAQLVQLWAGRPRFESQEIRFFLLHSIQTGSAAHPASYPIGTSGEGRPGSEAEHSSTSSAEINNGGAIPLLPQMS
jgi:hypothetical protein